jgi:hypothetical protein
VPAENAKTAMYAGINVCRYFRTNKIKQEEIKWQEVDFRASAAVTWAT